MPALYWLYAVGGACCQVASYHWQLHQQNGVNAETFHAVLGISATGVCMKGSAYVLCCVPLVTSLDAILVLLQTGKVL